MRTSTSTSIRIATVALVVAAFMVPAPAAFADGLCGSEVTTPDTTITLSADLHCSGRGFIVRANNVTINLDGHTMFGSGSREYEPELGFPAGIALVGANNTHIVNGTITGFANGMRVEHSRATVVQNLTIKGTNNFGMILADSNGVALDHTTLTGPGHDGSWISGIYGTNVSNFSATNVVVSNWSDSGIYMNPVAGFSVTHSSMTENWSDGISVWNSGGRITIDRSTFAKNHNGVLVGNTYRSASVVISNSTMNDNQQHGLYMINVTSSRILGVTTNHNGGEGIWMDSGMDWTYGIPIPFYTTIQGSTAIGNGHSGISLSFAGRWWLSGNRAESNGDSGFAFYGGEAYLTRNTSQGNDDDGFTWEDGSRGTSTGDIATNNQRHGVLLRNGAGNTVTLTGTNATHNRATGLTAESGIASVTSGSYSYNGADGIRASSGKVNANRVTAFKNGVNGIAFVRGATGSVTRVTSSKNGLYGICIDRSARVSDVPPHVLYANGVAARGTLCTGFYFFPHVPRTTP